MNDKAKIHDGVIKYTKFEKNKQGVYQMSFAVSVPDLGEDVWVNLLAEGDYAYILGQTLRNFGYEGEDIEELDQSHPNHFSLTGKEVKVKSKTNVGKDGKQYVNWQFVGGGGAKVEVQSQDKKRLAASIFSKPPADGGKKPQQTASSSNGRNKEMEEFF